MSLGFTSMEHRKNYERNVRESIWQGTIEDAIPALEELGKHIHTEAHHRGDSWETCGEYGCAVVQRMIATFKRRLGP